ncbi:hypothetical protein GCM10022403_000550 [Streptomyces coacervatus]|uniref:Peptidase E n=1 Tax=Streptomyces coacervatus TaxID=647381 RepID=A0ABP7GMD6_9ACTN|nr:Type 1 glutamine amidotransferase-like domain-containing protein [Streptomyces coacervatus]MDF2265107.1 Type 1 glutamine amidotransferase-like domain-containing protein [Streptomyces coacervatus]
MAAPPERQRRLALLGGGFSLDDDGVLDDWVLSHARTSRPRVCFLPTASGDAVAHVERFFAAFRSRGDCEAAVLPLFQRELDDEGLRSFLLAQDVVYVGGGNTANMPAIWRVHGVDRLLEETVSRVPGARVYRVEPDGRGGVDERPLPCRSIE